MKAYIFPGQGSQCPGMAKDIYENNPGAKQLLERANDILGFRITDVMFEGTADELKETKVTQPAVFLHSYAAYKFSGLNAPDMMAGHSLGELTALSACGVLDFEDALKLVSTRARLMQECCDRNPGAMAAVIGLDAKLIEDICQGVESGIVIPANYNSDRQTVISGESQAVDEACVKLKEAGARRALKLPVGGAFHSPLMEDARNEFAKAVEKTIFHKGICPVYQNVTGLPSTQPEEIRGNLIQQLTSPVRWTHSVRNMIADGALEFIEFGPGTVLTGPIKKIKENA